MTTTRAEGRRAAARGRRRPVVIALVALLAVLLGVAAWVVLRGLAARDQLLGALPLAAAVRQQVADGDGDIAAELDELQGRTQSARELTSDPVWRAVELVPWAGQNLRAFREAAATVDDVADDALPPLGRLASSITLGSLTPRDGRIDLQPILDAAPVLADAATALEQADARASAIETEGTLPQISEAVGELVGLVDETASIVSGLDTAARLLPGMLGGDAQRDYLLLFLNNAELRAGGGIPGALAVLTADDGALAITAQSSASALGEFATAPEPLTEVERTLFGEATGLFMQNVTATPDFVRSAELAQAMWAERQGQTVDGVIGLDVPALARILEATGPVALADGTELTSDNAVQVLLSDTYARLPEPSAQDAYFADAAQRVFAAVTNGGVEPGALVDALVNAAGNDRLTVWSADPDEQEVLTAIDLAGALPVSDERVTLFGVYLNDSTGAKMDYYLRTAIGLGSVTCRDDERPSYRVAVRLENTAPANAATTLPDYVTGAGAFGVPAGTIRTNVFVYGPPGSVAYDVRLDSQSVGFVSAEHDGLTATGATIDLEPGELAELEVLFVGAEPSSARLDIDHTPAASSILLTPNAPLSCRDVAADD
ncbi:DUF4012 domain-containing protein [Microcella alkalica]|uniref:DUF4012 domain-containing protein n=1 Tax=Microcella alkalica TaxID=355930 RepID=UPI00145C5B80|nr:DUF4012 domain-containing protein [Microcella alkalica]